MTSQDWLFAIFARHRWLAVPAALLLTAAAALLGGYLLAEVGPLFAGLGLAALLLALWMLRQIEVAYWAVIGVVCLLPFASFPFSIGFTPTFLDAALGALFLNEPVDRARVLGLALGMAGYDCVRDEEIDAVALLTDGAAKFAVDISSGRPGAALFEKLFAFAADPNLSAGERDAALADFLASERVCRYSDDDKTIVLAVRVPPEVSE